MGLLDWIFRKKPPTEIEGQLSKGLLSPENQNFTQEDKESIDSYVASIVSIINMNLRGMADKVAKQRNTELITEHLKNVFMDGYQLGYRDGSNDMALGTLKGEITNN